MQLVAMLTLLPCLHFDFDFVTNVMYGCASAYPHPYLTSSKDLRGCHA